jgi:glutamate racemase
MTTPTIGVFDSGFGGLTVLRELLPRIPGAHYIYLGDTARLPYGAKSQATIARYAVESARFLHSRGAQMLVIACNTASALALDDIRAAVPIPVVGVIEPGARAALHALAPLTPCHPERSDARTSSIAQLKDLEASSLPPTSDTIPPQALILATTATVQSHAYRHACEALGLHATELACPLLVPLVEEGWTDHPVTRDVLRIYLTEALSRCTPNVVLLGCTHYPLIATAIQQTLRDLGSQASVIDSARATAAAVQTLLGPTTATGHITLSCYATDSTEKFAHLGSRFLGQPIPKVELLDLGG